MISNLISHQTNHNSSPFNTIRHLDDNGNEHWLARELMALLGYKKWERFVDAIDRTKIGCQNTGVSVQNHFTVAGLYRTHARSRRFHTLDGWGFLKYPMIWSWRWLHD